MEDIYEAALYTLQSQPFAPSVPSPRNIILLSPQLPNAPASFQAPPQAPTTFPPMLEGPPLVQVVPTSPGQVPSDQQHAPLNLFSRGDFSP
jgi:hypothetical protein